MSHAEDPAQIPKGAKVEAEHADLGDSDVGAPTVEGVVPHPETGEPALEIKQGGLFRKRIIVPSGRINRERAGTVRIESGIRPQPPAAGREAGSEAAHVSLGSALKALGPGVIAGAADNDPTTVGTLAVIGSQTTFGLSWLLLLVLPMMAGVQAVAGAVGNTSGKNLQVLIRDRFGMRWSWVALAFLIGVNVFTLAADLEGGAAALGLITHLNWRIFTLPLAAGVGAVLVFGSYTWVRRILTVVLFVFLLYVPAAFLSHPDWGQVLRGTFIPRISFEKDYIAGALALLGTTLTSYVYFWETIEEAERETERPRILTQLDAVSGMVAATAVFWFILVSTGATLGVHHQTVQTAQDAAGALKPIAGPLAQYLFAGGLLASALLALPLLASTTAYSVGEALGWPVGLSRPPWRSQGFYLVVVASLLAVVPLTFAGIEPIQLLFLAGVVGGVGTPLLLVMLLVIAGDRRIMKNRPVARGIRALGWATAAIIALATAAYLLSQVFS